VNRLPRRQSNKHDFYRGNEHCRYGRQLGKWFKIYCRIYKSADFQNCHETFGFGCLFFQTDEKIVDFGMIGTDLLLQDDISLFISQIHSNLRLVLVDSERCTQAG
jgi:hypothetical protein